MNEPKPCPTLVDITWCIFKVLYEPGRILVGHERHASVCVVDGRKELGHVGARLHHQTRIQGAHNCYLDAPEKFRIIVRPLRSNYFIFT